MEFLWRGMFSAAMYRKMRYCDNSRLAFRYVLLSRANALYDRAIRSERQCWQEDAWLVGSARGRWRKTTPRTCTLHLRIQSAVGFMAGALSRRDLCEPPCLPLEIAFPLSLANDNYALSIPLRIFTSSSTISSILPRCRVKGTNKIIRKMRRARR